MSAADHQIYRGYIFPFAMTCDQVTAAAVRMLLLCYYLYFPRLKYELINFLPEAEIEKNIFQIELEKSSSLFKP